MALRASKAEQERARLRAHAAELEQIASESQSRLLGTEEQLAKFLNSRSWRLTKPLRLFSYMGQLGLSRPSRHLRTILLALFPKNKSERIIVMQAITRRFPRVQGALEKMGLSLSRAPHVWRPRNENTEIKSLAKLPLHEAAAFNYQIWSLRFDTPSAIELKYLAESEKYTADVLIVIPFSKKNVHRIWAVFDNIKKSVGVDWVVVAINIDVDETEFQIAFAEASRGEKVFCRGGIENKIENKIIVCMEPESIPRSHAFRCFADAMLKNSNATLSYSDEDIISEDGVIHSPWMKPRFSRVLAKQGLLFGDFFATTNAVMPVAKIENMLSVEGKSLSDVALCIAEKSLDTQILHVPHVLFHSSNGKTAEAGVSRVNGAVEERPFVSILIATRDKWSLLGPCLESIKITNWPKDKLEVIVVDNGSVEVETLDNLSASEALGEIRVIRDPMKFNFSALNNLAAKSARGDILVLLNNDTEIIDPDWIWKLCRYAVLPNVGAVGAKLLYSDRTVQHGGIILGIQGVAAHAHVFLKQTDGGYRNLANTTREVAAVTGAVLAVSRSAFEAVGGLREDFAVSFNDVMLCLDLLEMGRKNIYVADCVVIHHESKSRGFDTTAEKIELARSEAIKAWITHKNYMVDDPYYSPNLSLEHPYELSFAPRRRAAWQKSPDLDIKIMVLSSTYAIGHGVAVVIDLQVRELMRRGHQIVLVGRRSENDYRYDGIEIIEMQDPRSIATLAIDSQVDIIVAHTPPYFSVSRWVGVYPPVIAYDYGEPPPRFFPDAAARREVLADKNISMRMATKVFAISQAVADESVVAPDAVIPLGNAHLGRWSSDFRVRREVIRGFHGWSSKFVVLNVCRFHAGEVLYKGVDKFSEVKAALDSFDPDFATRCVFVLCGKGDEADVDRMRALGLTVHANVSDEEMLDLYAAADIYMNFSRWEGYNLGIGQALAMGLNVIASDIPAHRAFGVDLVVDSVEASIILREKMQTEGVREARIWEWNHSINWFCNEVEALAHLN